MDKYYCFRTPVTNSITIKRSEFITNLIPVTSEQEIEEHLKNLRKKYYDATHNCYAYILGTNNEIKYKASDDGEPSRTAGVPILDSLQKNNLTNCLCVVTRYFGGIKLGAGGLVRAYSESASSAISLITDLEEIIEKTKITITLSYDLTNIVLKQMNSYTLIDKNFLNDVVLTYELPKEKRDEVIANLINSTNGKISIK